MADDENLDDDDDDDDNELRLSTSERLKQSKKRRAQQLRKYAQHEKQLEKESAKKSKKPEKPAERKKLKAVQFPGSVTLLEAAARDDKDEVRRLLRMGVDPDVCNDDGLTALHQCCIDDAGGMMNVLLEFGAKVNATDCELWTPLHAAATCGKVNLCRTLIEHGADLLAVNGDGNMPYDICDHEATLDFIEYEMAKQGVTQETIDETRLVREKKMLEDLKELHRNKGNLEFRGRSGETPLHIAAANGYLDVADFLLSRNVRVDAVDADQWQPIHCAACWGQLAVLELLLEHGASLEAMTSLGSTVIDICEDVEMKRRIVEIKDEIENSRIAKSRELSRRHSSTIRRNRVTRGDSVMFSSQISLEKSPLSASIRRTSMREKNEMSWKDAKEEARKMRESSQMFQDVEDDDVKPKIGGHLSVHGQRNVAPSGGNALTPLISVEEVLNIQIDELSDRARSPELVGRGTGFSTISPGLAEDDGAKNREPTNVKINGSSPQSTDLKEPPSGTLCALKKQRSSNRLSDHRLSESSLESGSMNLTSNKAPYTEPVLLQTNISTDCPKSSNKPSNHRINFPHKCCAII